MAMVPSSGSASSTTSTSAKASRASEQLVRQRPCLADGKESQDFVFFRMKNKLRMQVTINDTDSVELIRCPVGGGGKGGGGGGGVNRSYAAWPTGC